MTRLGFRLLKERTLMGDLLRFPAPPDLRDDDFERRLDQTFEDFGVMRLDRNQAGAEGD